MLFDRPSPREFAEVVVALVYGVFWLALVAVIVTSPLWFPVLAALLGFKLAT